MSSVFLVNKGVSKPIVFKGLKAQYIAYLALGLVVLLVGFAVLYICGLGLRLILPLVLCLGTCLFFGVFKLSARFGKYGLMKFWAARSLPGHLVIRTRRVFLGLASKGGRDGR